MDKITDSASLTVKSKVVKLRQDLDNTSSRIQMLVKSNIMSYYAGICDAKTREGFRDFQNKMLDFTLKMSEISSKLSETKGGENTDSIDEATKASEQLNSLLQQTAIPSTGN